MRDAVGDEGRLGDGERGAGAMEVAVARLERVEDVPGESQVALEFLAGASLSRVLEGASLEICASSREWDFSFRDDARAPASGVQTSVKTDAAREPVERERRGSLPGCGRMSKVGTPCFPVATSSTSPIDTTTGRHRERTCEAWRRRGGTTKQSRSRAAREVPSMRPTRSDLGSLVQSCGAMPSDGACCPRRGCALLCPEVPKSTHLDDLPSSRIPALGPRPHSPAASTRQSRRRRRRRTWIT